MHRSTDDNRSVAIVHDYLNQPGGAERVVLEMARIWPSAPIYTSLYRPDSTYAAFAERCIRTSPLDCLPVDRRFRALAPLYPLAFRSFGTLDHDVVISSSSGWAHGVRTEAQTLHVVYCHTPARWVYSPDRYFDSAGRNRLLAPLIGVLRRWDQSAARRADAYIANTENVRRRIRAAYRVDADVVYPPVDTERFTPRPRGERFLVVSRLLRYKRVDLAVAAATAASLPLDVVGAGPAFEALRAIAGPTVIFHGRLTDQAVTEMMETCRAVVLPGAEDFGILPIEANAAGKPVIAFAAGGALETLQDGVTATFFKEPSVESLLDALRRSDELDTPPENLGRAAERFSRDNFALELVAAVERAVDAKASPASPVPR